METFNSLTCSPALVYNRATMPLLAGSRLGPYEILAAAGSGGMGEVYRARDTRLDRTVAIKILPSYLSEVLMRNSASSVRPGLFPRSSMPTSALCSTLAARTELTIWSWST